MIPDVGYDFHTKQRTFCMDKNNPFDIMPFNTELSCLVTTINAFLINRDFPIRKRESFFEVS